MDETIVPVDYQESGQILDDEIFDEVRVCVVGTMDRFLTLGPVSHGCHYMLQLHYTTGPCYSVKSFSAFTGEVLVTFRGRAAAVYTPRSSISHDIYGVFK